MGVKGSANHFKIASLGRLGNINPSESSERVDANPCQILGTGTIGISVYRILGKECTQAGAFSSRIRLPGAARRKPAGEWHLHEAGDHRKIRTYVDFPTEG